MGEKIRPLCHWCHDGWQASALVAYCPERHLAPPSQTPTGSHTEHTHGGFHQMGALSYLARFRVFKSRHNHHSKTRKSNQSPSLNLDWNSGHSSPSFGPTEQPDGGAAEESAAGWHQGVQVPGGASAAGLHRAGGGEHLAAEAGLRAQTEPGEDRAVLQVSVFANREKKEKWVGRRSKAEHPLS